MDRKLGKLGGNYHTLIGIWEMGLGNGLTVGHACWIKRAGTFQGSAFYEQVQLYQLFQALLLFGFPHLPHVQLHILSRHLVPRLYVGTELVEQGSSKCIAGNVEATEGVKTDGKRAKTNYFGILVQDHMCVACTLHCFLKIVVHNTQTSRLDSPQMPSTPPLAPLPSCFCCKYCKFSLENIP